MTGEAHPQFVKNGIYKIILTNGQRFTGYFKGGRFNPKLGHNTFIFDIGESVKPGKEGPSFLILADADIKKATRMSPRYVDTVVSKNGALKYVAHFKYGED